MNEFHNLDPAEKIWWIQHAKLKAIWEELYPKTEFPAEIPDGPLLTKPWKDPTHYLNDKLKEVKRKIEKEIVDWERIQVGNSVIFCNYDGESITCENCEYRFKCELRGV